MNRQTVAVTFGTLALVVIGAILLYATPGPEATRVPKTGVVAQPGAKAKAAKVEKAKTPATPRKLPEKDLVHASELPADRAAAPAGAPNVVLIVASTQRRDQWTPYGGAEAVTPFLAERARQGVLLADALSVAADPRPADAALITGRYPHRVGVIETGEKRNIRPILPEAETLAERLAAAGWFTVGVSANHNLNRKAGGAQGFDWYRDAQPFSLMLEQRIDASEVVDKALARVAARSDAEKARPLFLQLATVDSHKPFRVPPDEFKPLEGPDHQIAPYRATLKRLDAAVSTLVAGLAEQGLTEKNTIFVVVGDHGEGLDMPVHHRKQHGFSLYGSTVRIPWLMWGPGLPAGRRVEGLASQVDLAPTLLSLLSLPAGGTDGMDLSAAITGKAPRTPRTEAYADTFFEGAHRASVWTATHQCQKDFGSTIELEDDTFVDACYDRVADPDFTKPVDQPALLARLEALHGELLAAAKASAPPAGAAGDGDGEDAE